MMWWCGDCVAIIYSLPKMGLCGSSMSADDKQSMVDNQKLDNVLAKKQNEENRVIKLLLLGMRCSTLDALDARRSTLVITRSTDRLWSDRLGVICWWGQVLVSRVNRRSSNKCKLFTVRRDSGNDHHQQISRSNSTTQLIAVVWCGVVVVMVCSENEKATFRYVLRRNVVESMQTLLMGCQKYNIAFKNGVCIRGGRGLVVVVMVVGCRFLQTVMCDV